MSDTATYILKRVVIGTLIALALMFIKGNILTEVYASTSKYTLYAQDYTVLWSNTVTTNQTINVQNVSRIRVNFTDAIAENSTYQITLKIDVTATDYVPYYNASGVFVGATGQDAEVATVSSTVTPQGSSSFLREAVITYTFKANNTSSDNFWEGSLTHTSRITYLNATISVSKIADNTGEQIANSTQDIINNNNSNTNTIINNQNENTTNIINNQNENTDKEIESQKVCNTITIDNNNAKETNKYLNSTGGYSTWNNYSVTDYISIQSDSILTAKEVLGGSSYNCFYTDDKTLISCFANSSLSSNQQIDIPSNAKYIRVSLYLGAQLPKFTLKNCVNGNQALNDSLTDDSIDSSGANDFFGDFNFGDDTLSSVITAPLRFFNKLSDTCQPITLTYLNQNIVLPCGDTIFWNRQDVSTFRTFWNILFGGIALYYLGTKLYKVVHDAFDPQKDNIEGVDI